MNTRNSPIRLVLHRRTELKAVLHVTAKELSQLLALKPRHSSITSVEDDPFVFAPAVNDAEPVRWSSIESRILTESPLSWLFVLPPSITPADVSNSYSYFNA